MRTIDKIRCINESHSVADNIIDFVDNLLATIEKEYINYPCESAERGIYRFTHKSSYQLWGQNITFDLTIYDFFDIRLCEERKEQLNVGYFDAENGVIKANIVMLFGTVCRECSETTLRHELEHCYQWALNKANNPNFITLTDEAYKHASKIVVSPRGSVDEYSRYVAWIIYYANPREQDAFIQEYYRQAKADFFKFQTHTTDIDKRIRMFRNYLDFIEEERLDPSMKNALDFYKQFGYTAESIFRYGERGYKRFVNKQKHVADRVRAEINTRAPIEGVEESINQMRKTESIKLLARDIARKVMKELRDKC